MNPALLFERPTLRFVPLMLLGAAAPLAATAASMAAPCDEYAKAQRVVSAGAVGGAPDSATRTAPSGRSVAVRIENGKVSVEVDGSLIPESRLRRDGDRLTVLDAGGAPLSGVPPIVVQDGSGGIAIGGNSSASADLDRVVSDVVVAGRDLAELWGPRIKAEVERAMAEAGRAAASAGRAVGESGAASDLWRRLAVTAPRGDGAPASATIRASVPKVMLGVTLAEPDAALQRHLSLDPGATTLLADVRPDLPAAKAGLESFDIVVAVNGAKPADPAAIRAVLAERNAGDSLKFTVRRGAETKEFDVVLAAFDGSLLGDTSGFELVVDGEGEVQPFIEMLRGQLRLAPMQNGEGDFLFELDTTGQGGPQWRSGTGSGTGAGTGAAPRRGAAAGADSSPGSPSATGGGMSPRIAVPGVPLDAALRSRGPAAPPSGADQRLEQLEQRLDELSTRIERMLERLEKSQR